MTRMQGGDSWYVAEKNGSSGRTRTYNPPVNSRTMCELLIDSKGFSSGSRASQPLYLGGLARQIARQFIHFTHRSGNSARMAHLHRNEFRTSGEGRLHYPQLPVALGSPSEIPLPLV